MNNKGCKILEIRNLRTVFSQEGEIVKAVDGVSFTLYKGETLGVVGESGSGKTVTALSLMQLIPTPPGMITGGEAWYFPDDRPPVNLLELTPAEMRFYRGKEMAMIFQEPMTSLNPVFRCGHQVAEAIQWHKKVSQTKAKTETLALFERVQLPDPERIYRAYPHQLSGGQKQRVMIAMAMSCDPNVLIADEPTTALDVTVQRRILQLMAQLKSELDASVLFITHDLGVIAEIADRVIVMYKGQIVESGSVTDIFSDPQHPYTKSLLACRPPLEPRLRRLPVVADFMDVEETGAGQIKISAKLTGLSAILDELRIPPAETKLRLQTLQSRSPVLRVRNLRTWFPVRNNVFGRPTEYIKAVDDVSFEVFPGETLGLVGESGCGKTTLGRSIVGLNSPQAGSVIYKGQDLLRLDAAEMRKIRKDIQFIFQDPYSSLNPRMTIGEALMEPLSVHNILDNTARRRERVLEMLHTVGLEPKHFNRYPQEFSGGQRQRVCIARALVLEPHFIICDESVSALDVSVQAQVLNLLLRLREQFDLSYIFISHDLSVVKFMSDRMMVMNQGKIEEMGPADEIYKYPKAAYTQHLIAAIPKGL